MQLGTLVSFHPTGGDPEAVRDYAQCLEATGCDSLEAPDTDTSPPESGCGFVGR